MSPCWYPSDGSFPFVVMASYAVRRGDPDKELSHLRERDSCWKILTHSGSR